MEIASSARRHGISDDDIRHAVRNVVGAIRAPDQPDFQMMIGPDTAGRLLEVGVLTDEDGDYIIHAMRARQRYVRMIVDEQSGEA